MLFNCKIALFGLTTVTVVSAHSGSARFDIHTCDHLRLTDDDQCVETTHYGNDHDCDIRVLSDFRIDVRRWDVENHQDCAWDFLEAKGVDVLDIGVHAPDKRFCTESPAGYDVYKGQVLHWHTDFSVTKGGWKLCATPKFRFRGSCDHLDITDDGNCVETREYGNDHDCTIETTGNFLITSEKFDVEDGTHDCFDYLKIDGQKNCGSGDWGDFRNTHGSLWEWHTDFSVTRGGFRMCGDSCIKSHKAYGGEDVYNYAVFTDSALECQKLCEPHSTCRYFTYNSGNRRCHMKASITNTNNDAPWYFISGDWHCREGNWRRLEDSKQGGSRLLKLAEVIDSDLKMEKEE